MGPKTKVWRLEKGQKTLCFGKNNNETEGTDTTVNNVVSEDESHSRKRSFHSGWMTLYPWLAYDSKENFMFCKVCTDNNKDNGMVKKSKCTNVRKSTLERLASLADHMMLIQAPLLRNDMKMCRAKASENIDRAIIALMKSVHWLILENIPLSKYRSLIGFTQDLSVEDVQILKEGEINYDSPTQSLS